MFLERVEPCGAFLASALERGWIIHLTILTMTNSPFGGPRVTPELMKRFAALGVLTTWKTGFATSDDAFDSEIPPVAPMR